MELIASFLGGGALTSSFISSGSNPLVYYQSIKDSECHPYGTSNILKLF